MELRWIGICALALALTACGGGGDAPPADPGAALAGAQRALADPARCAAGEGDAAIVDGQCVAVYTELGAQRAKPGAQRAEPPMTTPDSYTFFSWAVRQFPSLFSGSSNDGSLPVPPFGTIVYRYFSGTGNYLATIDSAVYLFGPVVGYRLTYVATLADFGCAMYGCGGSSGGGTSGGGTSGGGSSGGSSGGGSISSGSSTTGSISSGGSTQYSIYLNAGTTYTISLRGNSTGGGTLSDPYLELKSPGGSVVASNDDGGTGLDSQLSYTPGSSGTYTIVARSYSGSTGGGSYTLSVSGSGGGTSGGGTSGGGSSGGGSSGGGGGGGYISWNGSINGTTVKDSDNENYQVRASDGVVVDPSGASLTGLVVDSSANVRQSGSTIGYVGLANAASGSGQVAVFYCSSGSYMNIITTSTSYQTSCGSGGGTSGGGTSGGDTSGGGTSGGGTSGGGTSGGGSSGGGTSGGSSRSFYTWTGSSNGEVVLDANNERFRFYSDTGCIYSDNTRTEYTNFCLSGNTVYFAGESYAVTRIRSTTGSCIAGLITSDGYFADIFTGSNRRIEYIQQSSVRPRSC